MSNVSLKVWIWEYIRVMYNFFDIKSSFCPIISIKTNAIIFSLIYSRNLTALCKYSLELYLLHVKQYLIYKNVLLTQYIS